MAARLAGDNVRRMHQSLHHVVADAPWSDEAVLDRCLDFVIPMMLRRDPVVAWVVDDTGFPKKGRESVGVARQYCGQVGKQDNCRVAVSLSMTTEKASMPVAYRLYLPQSWIEDRKRRKKTGVPDSIQFQTKLEIARDQNPARAGARNPARRGAGRCRLWGRHGFPCGADEVADGLRRGNPEHYDGLETRRRTKVRAGAQGQHRAASQTAAARCQPPAGLSERACSITAHGSLEESGLAARGEAEIAVPLCGPAGGPGASRLLVIGTTSRRMVADRMASRGIGTNQVLALHSSSRRRSRRTRALGQTPLDHRTGLPGTEAGTRVGPLRRTRLARISSSRHVMHCGLWIPGGRTESFFPLSPRRRSWITNARTAARLPAARFAAFVPSGIIRAPSRRFECSWPIVCSAASFRAPTADHAQAHCGFQSI